RLFTESDTAMPVAVISHGYWQRAFGGDPGVAGKPLLIEGKPFTIIGVSAAGFTGVRPGKVPDFLVPMAFEPYLRTRSWLHQPSFGWIAILGRLRGDTPASRAEANLNAAYRGFLADNAPGSDRASQQVRQQSLILVNGGHGLSALRNQYSRPLYVLMAVA